MLASRFGADVCVEAVHGRLKREIREQIMGRFRRGETHVLVATTVIEVGVDIPNATLMVIEHAERFGLAQLHQLRGRIGRGGHGRTSVCVFIAEPTTDEAVSRMKAIADTRDGFVIAEKDLEIRGMGDFFGTRQHGMPPLRVATLPQDMDLLELAQRDARQIVARDPKLGGPELALLRKLLIREYGDSLQLIDVG
jgi:ATP-dependent DNA helicase RecG